MTKESPYATAGAGAEEMIPRHVILRDLMILQLKLWLDGLKDIVFAPVSVVAAGLDMLSRSPARGRHFYGVLRQIERFDLWLNLYGAAKQGAGTGEGLFGGSEPGDETMVGRIEELATHRRPRPRARRPASTAGVDLEV